MGKTLSETVSRAGARWSAVVLGLLACLLVAGCAHDSSSEKDRPGGFYGGVSGGKGM